ncbi:50S ribosomal protein L9 [Aurantiacibacter poecillastricola]|uniref:50S ribosomal protein L9 n=1 Tax=Aurantiacibacter poecillastricola TaxID=3064385 RepID=UPI00273F1CE5|nr:50S ribosomal protein L9 [Aurantiacibacter sp. 219JJ12-13]MDP5261785.1 50S ribosomal protein L9 [Aurantiacibacter sp. 219JJ12-13]
MDIILLERIGNLGQIGDIVTVKDGYARNFLLPQKKALRANAANKQVFEANRERLEAENAEKREAAKKQGETVEGTEIVLIRAASNAGQLYGSVNVRDVAAALADKGHDIDKKQVIMGAPIKTIGMFDVTVALHAEVEVTIKANVARSEDEAELQSQGVDILKQAAEDEAAAIAGEGFQEELDPDRELGDLPTPIDAEGNPIEEPAEGEEDGDNANA